MERYDELRFWHLHELRRFRASARAGFNTKADRRKAQKELVSLRKEHYMAEAAKSNVTEIPRKAKTPKERKPKTVASYPLTAVITLLKDKEGKQYGKDNNPKRVGSNASKLFAKYFDGMTVADFAKIGGRASALKYDMEHNFISIK